MKKTSDLYTIIISSRPISWINTAFPFAAGYLYITHSFDVLLVVGTLYFLIPYNLMMYGVNDVYDYESDLRNPRKGGVEGALLPPRIHKKLLYTVALINIPFLVALSFLLGSIASIVFLGLVVFMALAYSVPGLRFKERPIIDSITSSFHFVSPLVLALIVTGWKNDYFLFVIAFFAWGMASHAFGAVQDIVADRKARIHSIATKYGASMTSRFAFVLYLFPSCLLISRGGFIAIVGVTLLTYVFMVAPYLSLDDKAAEKANNGWRHFLKINQLTGFVVTILLILSY